MTSLSRPRVEFISTILQTVLNLGLLCLGLILVVFLGKETVHLADVLFAPEQTSKYELVEGLVVYFLYFEFIALIVKSGVRKSPRVPRSEWHGSGKRSDHRRSL